MSVLVSYASKHGSTREVAEVIGRALRGAGLEVDVRPSGDVDLEEDVGAVILGSAIYMGSWLRDAEDFATRNAAALQARPVWLFSVGPLGEPVDDAEEQPRQLAMLRDTLEPREHVLFHGRLDPASLGFAERVMMKAVRAPAGDFRNWDEITDWAHRVAVALRAELVGGAPVDAEQQ